MDYNTAKTYQCAAPDGALGGCVTNFSTDVPSRWD